jgi:ABC-type glutathione transport system ATPase component
VILPVITRPRAHGLTHAEELNRAEEPTRAASAPSPLAVELRDVHRRYGSVEALRGVDLSVRRGELTAILGPNGAGKTTTLSLILGLRQPSSGSVRVLGDVAGSLAARRRVGAMLQESGVPPTLTIAELIAPRWGIGGRAGPRTGGRRCAPDAGACPILASDANDSGLRGRELAWEAKIEHRNGVGGPLRRPILVC